ncbi:uncharacterized protein METZ01_LOCUS292007, partial [marine metagenome]
VVIGFFKFHLHRRHEKVEVKHEESLLDRAIREGSSGLSRAHWVPALMSIAIFCARWRGSYLIGLGRYRGEVAPIGRQAPQALGLGVAQGMDFLVRLATSQGGPCTLFFSEQKNRPTPSRDCIDLGSALPQRIRIAGIWAH